MLAKIIAKLNCDVSLKMRVLAEEKNVFYDHLVKTKLFLEKKLKQINKQKLEGWIVCGSGLASLPQSPQIKILLEIEVGKIPFWFIPQAPGHGKKLIFAEIKGQTVGIMTGRGHLYDTDYSPASLRMITAPLIVAKGLGVSWLITTNAAGVLDNGRIKVGDVLVDVDYVNQQGVNPLLGFNDSRLGERFSGKSDIADPEIYARLQKIIPVENFHLGIYTLASNTPFYEGAADVERGIYPEILRQNPNLGLCFGMSFALEAMVLSHYNLPSKDKEGFDRKIHWLGLTAATNLIPKVRAPTISSVANPTSPEEVLSGGSLAEKTLIPAIIKLCNCFTKQPLS